MKYLAGLSVLAMSVPAAAQDAVDERPAETSEDRTTIQRRADDVVALLNGKAAPSDIFTDGFLAAIPGAQLAALSQQMTSQYGAALSVELVDPPRGNRSALVIRMERAIVQGGIAIDPGNGGKITELLFQKFEPANDSLTRIETDLQALPGKVTAYFGPLEGSADALAIAPDAQMPIGSTMKLFVLAALGREIAQGKRAWSDVVTLDARSFPSGQMQDWPGGSPVTLHTLASMMISISDNTATDQLIALVGDKAMADILQLGSHSAPDRNAPWLTTRDLFTLKGGDPVRVKSYASAEPKVRQQILESLAGEPVSPDAVNLAFAEGPVALDVEWFASASDLARLFQLMRRECDPQVFAIMGINRGIAPGVAEKWDYVGYKGGSEPGVLNLTWLLRDKSGQDHMLSLSWANPDAALSEATLESIAQRILSLSQ